jgi:iron(III) transport system permease protein
MGATASSGPWVERVGSVGFRTLSLGAAAAVIILIALPLSALVVQAVLPDLFGAPPSLTFSLAGVVSLLADPYTLAAGVDSLLLAAATAVAASALGVALAYVLILTDMPGRGVIWGMVWLVFISPSFLLAQGWELLLAPGGLTAALLGGVFARALLSPWGVLGVLALKLFPFAVLAAAPALEGIGQDAVHAARLAGAPWGTTWRRVLLPLIAPAIVSGALVVFAEVLSDFGVAATLAQSADFPLVTYSIYSALEQFPTNFPEAAASSLLLVASVALAQWGQRAATGRRLFATRLGGSRSLSRVRLGRGRWPAFAACLVLGAVAFAVPAGTTLFASFVPTTAGGLSPHAFTLANYAQAMRIPYGADAFARSLLYSLGAAALGVVLGLGITLAWRRASDRLTAVLQGLLTTTIAVPGIVLGAGYIFFWDQPALSRVGLLLYGTPAALLMAYVAGGLPYSVRMATGAVAQIPDGAIQAARTAGAGLGAVVRRIVAPMLADTWLRIGLMLFAGAMFELPVSELLYPPGAPTLAVAIVHQFHNTQLGVGAALTALSTAGVGALSGLVLLARRLVRPAWAGAIASVPAEPVGIGGVAV